MGIVKPGSRASICNDYLRLASEAVRDSQSSEGSLRTAISRAYYAVFLSVRDHLFGPDGANLTSRKRNKLVRKFRQAQKKSKWYPGSHDLIIFSITDVILTGMVRPVTLSQQVSQLKEARIHADYDFTSQNLKNIPYSTWREYANESIALASQLLPLAEKLPAH